jgi:hypothetical protein
VLEDLCRGRVRFEVRLDYVRFEILIYAIHLRCSRAPARTRARNFGRHNNLSEYAAAGRRDASRYVAVLRVRLRDSQSHELTTVLSIARVGSPGLRRGCESGIRAAAVDRSIFYIYI